MSTTQDLERKITLGWEKVADILLTEPSTITVVGLDINRDKAYHIILTAKITLPVSALVYMYVEGDLAFANYYEQLIEQSGGVFSVFERANFPGLGMAEANGWGLFDTILVRDADGYARANCLSTFMRGNSLRSRVTAWTKTDPVANITRLDFTGAGVNFDVGTRLLIFRVV